LKRHFINKNKAAHDILEYEQKAAMTILSLFHKTFSLSCATSLSVY